MHLIPARAFFNEVGIGEEIARKNKKDTADESETIGSFCESAHLMADEWA